MMQWRNACLAFGFLAVLAPLHARTVADVAPTVTYLPWGQEASKDTCPDQSGFLWVSHRSGQSCVRYFKGGRPSEAKIAVVQFYGDRDRSARQPVDLISGNTQAYQGAYAARQASNIGVPFIVMARPGTYGSSGNHRQKREIQEFTAMSEALDLLKNRYGIERFIMMGHSGGATVIASLMTLGRSDIRCAILTSGLYYYVPRDVFWRMQNNLGVDYDRAANLLFDKYDPADHVGDIVADPDRQVYIVGDPKDQSTPFHLQVAFGWALRNHGHSVSILEATGKPPAHHDLTGGVALKLAKECVDSVLNR